MNPFLFEDIGSAVSDIYYDYCNWLGERSITIDDSYALAKDYSRHVFRELERAAEEIENLKTNVIPELKKEYEAKLYDERAAAAEKAGSPLALDNGLGKKYS